MSFNPDCFIERLLDRARAASRKACHFLRVTVREPMITKLDIAGSTPIARFILSQGFREFSKICCRSLVPVLVPLRQ